MSKSKANAIHINKSLQGYTATIREGYRVKRYNFNSYNAARNFVRRNFVRSEVYAR